MSYIIYFRLFDKRTSDGNRTLTVRNMRTYRTSTSRTVSRLYYIIDIQNLNRTYTYYLGIPTTLKRSI